MTGSDQTTQSVSSLAVEWQPIETAPRDGTFFLGFDPRGLQGHGIGAIRWYARDYHTYELIEGDTYKQITKSSGWWDGDDECQHPTHWTPLPPRPQPSE